MLGPAESVTCDASALSTVADDTCLCVLRHGSGAVSVLSATSAAAASGPHVRVLGTGGAFVTGPAPYEDGTAWERDEAERAAWLCDGSGAELRAAGGPGWAGFYDAAHAWLSHGAAPPVEPQEALRVMRVLDAARASARGGLTVRLGRPAGRPSNGDRPADALSARPRPAARNHAQPTEARSPRLDDRFQAVSVVVGE